MAFSEQIGYIMLLKSCLVKKYILMSKLKILLVGKCKKTMRQRR